MQQVVVREQWQEELVKSVRTIDDLLVYVPGADREVLRKVMGTMRMAITPHTVKLIDWTDARDPLLLMAVPAADELLVRDGEEVDPLGDTVQERVPFLTHRYPNRVLVYPTFTCSHYCRFCFRRFRTGVATVPPAPKDMETIREYLVAHPEVDEVILSGGDPLTLTDAMLERWLVLIRSVSSVVRIRIHTRVPVNLPSRITNELLEMLVKYQDAKRPVILVTHFNHVREIAEENVTAIARMVDHGIVVRNQSVLLRGVNDSVEVLEELCAGLTNIRVQPYYIHQLDLAKGTNHFRVPLVEAMDLMARLQGRVSGVALPRLMVSLPNGKGKVQAMQTCFEMVAEGKYRVKTWEGEVVEYCEPNERVTGN